MSLFVLGLNPSWQKTIRLPALQAGQVHRAESLQQYASGKGINCCRVLQVLGEAPTLLQFSGGEAGVRIAKELELAGLRVLNGDTLGETRTCTTLIEAQGRATEIIEPSPAVASAGLLNLGQALRQAVSGATGIAVCGTYPPGVTGEWFAPLQQRNKNCQLWIDGYTNVLPLLAASPDVLKINAQEILALAQEATVEECVRKLKQQWKIAAIVVTDGSRGATWYGAGSRLFAPAPGLVAPRNVIGAGDTFLAAWIAAQRQGLDARHALSQAVGTAAARCLVEFPWQLDTAQARQFSQQTMALLQEEPWC